MTTGTATRPAPDLSRRALFIGGRWVAPADGRVVDVISPSTEEGFAQAALAGATDIECAVAVARAAFESGPWPRMSPAERADILLRMADGIGEHAVALRYLSAAECGATVPVAEAFATSGVSLLRHYALAVASFRTTEEVVGLFSRAELRRVPLGVCGVIVPWNSPLSIALFSVAPALASGCSVVVKSPAETPLATYLLGDVATAAGLPPGVLNIVSADREVSETLVRNPEVDAVVFTGSTAVGRRVGSICGGRLAGMTLELGGKLAAIVLDDCDPAVVAQSLAPLTMLHNGQLCNNPTRVLLPRARREEYVDALVTAVASFTVGDPFDPATVIGPVISSAQRARIEGYIAGAKHDGARVLTGARRPVGHDRGYYIEPTLFDHVDSQLRIAREEVFGPVVVIIDYNDEAEALRIANHSDYGLSGNVWSPDETRALSVARRVRSGNVGINGNYVDWAVPFGGMKQSGCGRELGYAGLDAFHETQAIHRPL
jgi:betaine-aldehyde dehydrogenase